MNDLRFEYESLIGVCGISYYFWYFIISAILAIEKIFFPIYAKSTIFLFFNFLYTNQRKLLRKYEKIPSMETLSKNTMKKWPNLSKITKQWVKTKVKPNFSLFSQKKEVFGE